MLTRSFGSDIIDIDYSVRGRVGTDRDTQAITLIEQFHGDSHQKIQQSNQLTHVGYIKLKISSDTESDVLLSDDDVAESLLKTEIPEEKELGIDRVPMNPPVEIVDPLSVISSSATNAQLDSVAAHKDSASASFVERGFDKSIEQEVKETNVALSSVPELISFADMDSATDDAATPHGIVGEEDSRGASKDNNFTPTDAQVMSTLESRPITANGKSVQGNQQFSDNIS